MSVDTKEKMRNSVTGGTTGILDGFIANGNLWEAFRFGMENKKYLSPDKLLDFTRLFLKTDGWHPSVVQLGRENGMQDSEVLVYLRSTVTSYIAAGQNGAALSFVDEYGKKFGMPDSEITDVVVGNVKSLLNMRGYKRAADCMEAHGLPRERAIDLVIDKLTPAIMNESEKDVKEIKKAFKITEKEMEEAAKKAVDTICAVPHPGVYSLEKAIRIIDKYQLDKELRELIEKKIELECKALRRKE